MSEDRASSDRTTVVSRREKQRLLTDLLRSVSRSFYLTLRVLPRNVRGPVGLAYLLARAADTIADATPFSPEDRLRHLLEFRAQVFGPSDSTAVRKIADAVLNSPYDSRKRRDEMKAQPSPAAEPETLRTVGDSRNVSRGVTEETELLRSLPEVFALLEGLPEDDGHAVRTVVVASTRGMEIDLRTFPAEDSGDVAAFEAAKDLDDYVYHVAGCVGEFWTAISAAHTPSLRHWDLDEMSRLGVRFGKALQMTNVLRDAPKDLRIGRCYLPSKALAELGLTPSDLLVSGKGPNARPALVDGMRLALEHYEAAEQYVLAIPRLDLRLRLAALWPVVIGLGTLAKLARNTAWLDPDCPSKVNRAWVYGAIAFSLAVGRSNSILRWWMRRLRRKVEAAY